MGEVTVYSFTRGRVGNERSYSILIYKRKSWEWVKLQFTHLQEEELGMDEVTVYSFTRGRVGNERSYSSLNYKRENW